MMRVPWARPRAVAGAPVPFDRAKVIHPPRRRDVDDVTALSRVCVPRAARGARPRDAVLRFPEESAPIHPAGPREHVFFTHMVIVGQ